MADEQRLTFVMRNAGDILREAPVADWSALKPESVVDVLIPTEIAGFERRAILEKINDDRHVFVRGPNSRIEILGYAGKTVIVTGLLCLIVGAFLSQLATDQGLQVMKEARSLLAYNMIGATIIVLAVSDPRRCWFNIVETLKIVILCARKPNELTNGILWLNRIIQKYLKSLRRPAPSP